MVILDGGFTRQAGSSRMNFGRALDVRICTALWTGPDSLRSDHGSRLSGSRFLFAPSTPYARPSLETDRNRRALIARIGHDQGIGQAHLSFHSCSVYLGRKCLFWITDDSQGNQNSIDQQDYIGDPDSSAVLLWISALVFPQEGFTAVTIARVLTMPVI